MMDEHLSPVDLFRGEKVRLGRAEPETMAKAWWTWDRDTQFHRLLDNEPAKAHSFARLKESIEKDLDSPPVDYEFAIYTLDDDRMVGYVELRGISWNNRECWLGMGIGDRSEWNRGYGSDAVRLALRFGFDELNLHRISLGVFEYNRRAIRVYEKVGFRYEGRQRGMVLRDGQRAALLFMGILYSEWKSQRTGPVQ